MPFQVTNQDAAIFSSLVLDLWPLQRSQLNSLHQNEKEWLKVALKYQASYWFKILNWPFKKKKVISGR